MSHESDNDRYYRDLSSLKYNLSFAGCGFLGLYHVGVVCCLRKFAPHLYKNKPVSGASAGALTAACLVCDVNIGKYTFWFVLSPLPLSSAEIVQYICELIKNCRQYFFGPFDPRFKVNEHLREGLSRILPSDAHILCSERLSISLTSYATHKNVVVNRFKDRDELISAILCSTFIPIFSGFVPAVFRGQLVLDGGFSDNLLCIDRRTLTVSPFFGEADICPMDAHWDGQYTSPAPQWFEDWFGTIFFLNNTMHLNWTNLKRFTSMLWPMSPEELTSLAAQGYADALRFLTTRGFIACQIHQTPRAFVNNRRHTDAFSVSRPRPDLNSEVLSSPPPPKPTTTKISNGPRCKASRRRTVANSYSTRSTSVADSLDAADLVCVGLGLNVASCFACREKLRNARNSTLPAFIRSVIMGGVRARLPNSDYSYLQASKQTWTVVSSILHQSASYMYSLAYRTLCPPIVFQLELLVRVVNFATSVCEECWLIGGHLRSLLGTLEKAREIVSSCNSAYELELHLDEQWDTPNPFMIPQTYQPQCRKRHKPSHSGYPFGFADQIQSVFDSGTENISKFLFRCSPFQLPTAEECGLELFSTSVSNFLLRQSLPIAVQMSSSPSTSPVARRSASVDASVSETGRCLAKEPAEVNTSYTSSTSISITPTASDSEEVDELVGGTPKYFRPSPTSSRIRFSLQSGV
ncbi:Patatin-like phospholipase domain-containing protein 2 [Clonorchis sinensis]|uniref:Patatin-like phospholipase domain-containing protein 2 n=1 Tax=Clonorchis sinensis TaxID=79923 RepID=A0A8T1MQW9_CLOSI|nr:Patatin-like phospholipase domain-containing protein 2 [Clonorchis sinensis]